MSSDEKFSFGEAWQVGVWSFRSAWKIDARAMVVWTVISLAGSILPAFLMGQSSHVVDIVAERLRTGGSMDGMLLPLVLASLCLFGASLYYLLPQLMSQYMQIHFDKGAYHMMIDALKDIPIRWFDNPEFNTHLERYQSSANVTWFVLDSVRTIGHIGAVLSLFFLTLTASWPIFLIVLGLAVCNVAMAVRCSVREYKHWLDEGDSKKRLAYYRQTLTATWSAKDLRVLSAGPYFIARWRKEANEGLERRRVHDSKIAVQWDRLRLLGFFSIAAILGGALVFLSLGMLSLGQVMLFLSLAFGLPEALSQLGITMVRPLFVLRANRHFKKFFDQDWSEAGPAIPAGSGETSSPDTGCGGISVQDTRASGCGPASHEPSTSIPPGEVVFHLENVSYEYKPGHYALKDVSFEVKAGEIIALVGHNGAGKSTLAKILLGFYRPSAGRILYRGQAYTPEVVQDLSREIGATFQDFHLFQLSLRENVAFGNIRSLHDEDAIRKALRAGGGDTLLEKAGGDLDRHVGQWYTDDGISPSGGEWQRLATCRAFLNDRPVFVMDEPASMLDPEAEIRQFDSLRGKLGQRTAVLISHRIGFARLAHRIAVLDKGELVELGNHDELMAGEGHYHRLFKAQAEWYDHEKVPDALAAAAKDKGGEE